MTVRITDGNYGPPGRITNPAQLTLSSLDSRIGGEKSRNIDDQGGCSIQCYMYPLADLSVNHIIEFEMNMPRSYIESGGMKIRILDHNSRLFFGSQLNENNELAIPLFENAKYTLPVWFFTVRENFKLTSLDPWTGSILLRTEFRELTRSSGAVNTVSPINLVFGTGSTRGKRNYMEDVEFVFENIAVSDKRSVAVFGVLDGHGGKDCAQYASEDVPIKITTFLRQSMSCQEALFKSFVETDAEFLESAMGGNSGSTANISVYDKLSNHFYIANTADTRAVLCRRGVALDLSVDRKATDPEEIVRITKAGGYVVGGRVLGCLAVSRAFGDSQLKNNKKGVLVVNPEISRFSPGLLDEFVVIATDGLWDVMSSQAVVDMCKEMLQKENLLEYPTSRSKAEIVQQLSYIANHIAVHSVSNLKSQDNVTVMIVLLQGGDDNAAQIARFDEDEVAIIKHNATLLEELEQLKMDVSSGLEESATSGSLETYDKGISLHIPAAQVELNASIEVVPTVATMIFKKPTSFRANDGPPSSTVSHDSYLDATVLNSGSSKPPAPMSARNADSVSSSSKNNSSIVNNNSSNSSTAGAGVIGVLRTSSRDDSPVLKQKEKEKPTGKKKNDDDDDLMSFLSDDANF